MPSADVALDPRVARSKAAVLDAAVALLAESGYAGATVERIAARSGVAKTTIYRHWPSRAALLVDAFDALIQQPPAADTGTLRGDLEAQLGAFAHAVESSDWARILPTLADAAERDPELAALAREFSHHRRAPLRAILERARDRGEVAAGTDVEAVAQMIAGAFFYRRFLSREPVDATFVRAIVSMVLVGVAPSP